MKRIKITENDIKNMVFESVKRILNESTFFLGNDNEFPKELAKDIQAIAEVHGLEFEYKGDYVKVSIKFKDQLMWYTAGEIYGVKVNKDNTLNYWVCSIYPSGQQHRSGPGYPDTAIHGQRPVSVDDFLYMVEKSIEQLEKYNR